jgi:hypothetical protein
VTNEESEIMPLGPGKSGAHAKALLRESKARVVIVVRLFGDKGSAFDVAATDPSYLQEIPDLLREMARQIERDSPLPHREKQGPGVA